MPKFNRRGFLQVAGAASLAPLLPAIPTRAAVGAGGATTAQMLWASLYARAGSASNFASLARPMGISNHVAHGLYSKLAGTQFAAAHSAVRLNHAARPVQSAPAAPSVSTRSARFDAKRTLRETLSETSELEEQAEPGEVGTAEMAGAASEKPRAAPDQELQTGPTKQP